MADGSSIRQRLVGFALTLQIVRVLDGHSRLLGAGLLPGSLLIRPDDDLAAPPLWRDGTLAIPVPARSCGAARAV